MKMRIFEVGAEQADELFDEMPKPGDGISYNGGNYIITRVNVVNQRKLSLGIVKKRDVKRFEDHTDYSMDWPKLPDRFLEEDDTDLSFHKNRSLTVGTEDG